MGKVKKTDLKKVVKKAESAVIKNPVPHLEVRTTKPITEPKNKRTKPKEKTGNGKKTIEKKGQGKSGIKPKPERRNDKGNKGGKPKGGKAPVQRPPEKKERIGILDRILPPWF